MRRNVSSFSESVMEAVLTHASTSGKIRSDAMVSRVGRVLHFLMAEVLSKSGEQSLQSNNGLPRNLLFLIPPAHLSSCLRAL